MIPRNLPCTSKRLPLMAGVLANGCNLKAPPNETSPCSQARRQRPVSAFASVYFSKGQCFTTSRREQMAPQNS